MNVAVPLEELYLNNNKIKTLPLQISNLKKLRKLSLSNNNLKSVPPSLSLLTKLEFLNISSNLIEDFPTEILKLGQLRQLRVSNINFKSFPSLAIYNELHNLSTLYCYSTHIQEIKTTETNRDYLFLASFRGNCLQRLKSLTEITPIISSDQPPSRPSADSQKTHHIKQKGPMVVLRKPTNRNQIFICYSHKDAHWREEVEESIRTMQLEGIEVDYWSDSRLKTSDDWREEIFNALSKSKIAILLVSKSFLASEFVQKEELPRILDKAKNAELRVMSIIINYCRFKENSKLSKYQSLNPPETPLIGMAEDKQSQYLYKLTKDIEPFLK
ncbi:MAG: leucine-rich repeat domain-containing protein [Bacteroidales bacterium]